MNIPMKRLLDIIDEKNSWGKNELRSRILELLCDEVTISYVTTPPYTGERELKSKS